MLDFTTLYYRSAKVLKDTVASIAEGYGIKSLPNVFISPESPMDHRDHGDENDFKPSTAISQGRIDEIKVTNGQINWDDLKAARPDMTELVMGKPIEPVLAVNDGSDLAEMLRHGLEVGDFLSAPDGSLTPKVPGAGQINPTWVKVLTREMTIATGQRQNG